MEKRIRVLLVDDDPLILKTFRLVLGETFEVYTASNGEQGLEQLASHGPIDVIVSDLQMPVMDGIEFLQNANTAAPNTVQIMMSSSINTRS